MCREDIRQDRKHESWVEMNKHLGVMTVVDTPPPKATVN